MPEAQEETSAKRRKGAAKPKAQNPEKLAWPDTLLERAKAVQAIMREREGMTATEVAARFKRGKVEWVELIMETLAALGQIDLR